ncbi:MAG: hypothetical protein ACRELF_04670, partial [Gemmataceae bacterium]
VTIPVTPSNTGSGPSNSPPPPASNPQSHPQSHPQEAVENTETTLLPSLFQLELDAFLLESYIKLDSGGTDQGESASALDRQILGLWSAIIANPLINSSLGLYALQEGIALAQPSGGKK